MSIYLGIATLALFDAEFCVANHRFTGDHRGAEPAANRRPDAPSVPACYPVPATRADRMPNSSLNRAVKPVPIAAAGRAGFIALLLLTGLNLFNYIDRYILFGVQPLVQKEFSIGDEKFGALTTAFFVVYMLAAPLTGWLGDRFRRKPLILTGAFLWCALTLLTATVHSYQALYFRHAIVGLGEATFGIFAPALLADFYPEIDRNRILSFFYIAIPVGAALGYLIGGVLGARYGWRAPFFVSALPGLLIAIALWIWVQEPGRGSADRIAYASDLPVKDGGGVPSASAGWGDYLTSVYRGLARPAYLSATLGMAALVFSMGGISAFLPTFFVRFGGYSVSKAGLVVGGMTVVDGLLGTILGGWLAQRWLRHNHRALYLLSAWSALLAIPGAVVVFFGPRSLMIPAAFAAEFFIFLNTGPLNAAILNSVGARVRSTAIAVNLFLIHALGDAPSPRIIGHISDHSSLRTGLGVTLVTFAIAAILLFAGARYAPRLNDADPSNSTASDESF
jgi:MFS transporter, Spinster family, sphingosine-1-phosphate transporter